MIHAGIAYRTKADGTVSAGAGGHMRQKKRPRVQTMIDGTVSAGRGRIDGLAFDQSRVPAARLSPQGLEGWCLSRGVTAKIKVPFRAERAEHRQVTLVGLLTAGRKPIRDHATRDRRKRAAACDTAATSLRRKPSAGGRRCSHRRSMAVNGGRGRAAGAQQ